MNIQYHADGSCSPEAYLDRIGHTGSTVPSAENLFLLQSAHLHSVPYENLDILAGIPLSLDVIKLYEKIVLRRRGGYCFELNGLFGWLLRKLGYHVTDHFARFLRGENEIPKRRHRVLRVIVGEDAYICDVGVGSPCPEHPILLREGAVQTQRGVMYRHKRDCFHGNIIEEFWDGSWGPYYSFSEDIQLQVDFDTTDFYCQYAPQSIFRKGRMMGIMTPYGKNTVSGDVVKIIDAAGKREFTPASSGEWNAVYKDIFGLEI